MKKLHTIALGALMLAFAGSAQAILLNALAAGGTVTVGDKLFDQWTINAGGTANAANINVLGLPAAPGTELDPGHGLEFDILNDEFTLLGPNASRSLSFGFRVSVTDPLKKIKDNSLFDFLNDIAFDPATSDARVSVTELIGTAPGLSDLASTDVFQQQLGAITTVDTFDSATFAAQDSIWVTTTLDARATAVLDTVLFTGFSQRFSQVAIGVPEPATSLLMGIGLVAIGAVRRRRIRLGRATS